MGFSCEKQPVIIGAKRFDGLVFQFTKKNNAVVRSVRWVFEATEFEFWCKLSTDYSKTTWTPLVAVSWLEFRPQWRNGNDCLPAILCEMLQANPTWAAHRDSMKEFQQSAKKNMRVPLQKSRSAKKKTSKRNTMRSGWLQKIDRHQSWGSGPSAPKNKNILHECHHGLGKKLVWNSTKGFPLRLWWRTSFKDTCRRTNRTILLSTKRYRGADIHISRRRSRLNPSTIDGMWANAR